MDDSVNREERRTARSYIAGHDVGVAQEPVLSARLSLDDPATCERLSGTTAPGDHPAILGYCAIASPDDVSAATAAAHAAARRWADTPTTTRFALGGRFCRLLERLRGELVSLMTAEGCPARIADWQLDSLLGLFGDEACRWYRGLVDRQWRQGDRRLVLRYKPDGVLAVHPPSNAPVFSATTGALHGLLAGNAVVVRIPRKFALSTAFLLRDVLVPAMEQVGAPPGALNFFGAEAGPVLQAWLADPRVDDILYYGSSERGLRFQQACLRHGKKAVLELSGNDTVVVWHDAPVAPAADALAEAFHASGQLCIAPNRALVHPRVADEIVEAVRQRASALRPGYSDDGVTVLTPVPAERHLAEVRAAVAGGASLVCGGRRSTVSGEPHRDGAFLEPTVLRVDGLDAAASLPITREETFCPVLSVVVPGRRDDDALLSDMIAFLNANPYGLRNSLWTADPAIAERFLATVHNGAMLKVNQPHLDFVPPLPSHGGTGVSGGVYGEASYLFLKTAHLQAAVVAGFPT
ncbi:acyl-CoA reductase-like NAD-dependent aldehyde dehydrogenase [Saccharothrix tamanrassetensis]|uniref:Acyl-CoA reductase-like NAD-dependent aldehyde dehydrogenase n=1 Tax=Saccharothrix tamanrassetensis TaxID=1051531 RepID=A0A841CV19_9PSEU|nr:aldehyde dehydrogenase family protein [Saccharothrix tamanrassetensis]MBB5959795.1 acyl-CoA reductase-like NAD-dependent aldehyde dehydrogenase [Saccharothrix tamanrassetensis]